MPTNDSLRDFEALRQELERLVLRLKITADPQERRRLLRELRMDLKQADQLISLGK